MCLQYQFVTLCKPAARDGFFAQSWQLSRRGRKCCHNQPSRLTAIGVAFLEGGLVPWMVEMDKSIARLNIEHYRKLLAETTDEAKRQTLLRLLSEEEAKLKAALSKPPERRRRP